MNELGANKWLVYYKYTDMNGHTVEESEVISLWANEMELNNILRRLSPRIDRKRDIVIMNMVKLR